MEGGAESTESANGGPARSKLAALLLALAAPQAAQGFQARVDREFVRSECTKHVR